MILLPGMGADARMFAGQLEAFTNLRVLEWIPERAGESLADYAQRLAAPLAGEPVEFLGGASLGGMVALELARQLKPRAIFLLGSARSPRGIRPLLRPFMPLSAIAPLRALHRLGLPRPVIRLLGPREPEQVALLAEMVRDARPEFARWAILALRKWPGVADPGAPVVAIHGERDLVLPVGRASADHVIAGAGHLLTMTHPAEVNAILAREMNAADA